MVEEDFEGIREWVYTSAAGAAARHASGEREAWGQRQRHGASRGGHLASSRRLASRVRTAASQAGRDERRAAGASWGRERGSGQKTRGRGPGRFGLVGLVRRRQDRREKARGVGARVPLAAARSLR